MIRSAAASHFNVRALSRRRRIFPNTCPLRCHSSPSRNITDDKFAFVTELPWQFLRDWDTAKYDPVTQQRNDIPYDSATGKPIMTTTNSKASTPLTVQDYDIVQREYNSNNPQQQFEISWSDGVQTTHDLTTLEQQYQRWKYHPAADDRRQWTDLSENHVRTSTEMSLPFDTLVRDPSGMKRGLAALYYYGILLITETPVEDNGAGIAAIGAALGGGTIKQPSNSILSSYQAGGKDLVLPHGTDGPMRTLYGSVWATSSGSQPDGTSVADSAYGSDGLPLHTDFTYQSDPPGLQIFTMVQPALEGGESVFGDGLAVAEALRSSNPDAFDILSKTIRTYHSKDEVTGWNLQASGPVIQVDRDRIVAIRHNDLDRLPDLPPHGMTDATDIQDFYNSLKSAHTAWDSLLAQDKFRLVMKLKLGDTMVVANQVSSVYIA
jgi:Taurine catabolism dioxygenase TauD, TfdA family